MKEKLLLIDDEVSLLETMKMILQKSGYSVLTASTGIEALRVMQDHQNEISVVVSDLALPGGIDGIDLLEKSKELLPGIPVIMITAYANVETAVKAMQMGAFNFLSKPVNFKVLQQQIRKGMETAGLTRENRRLREEIDLINDQKYRIIYESQSVKRLLEQAEQVAGTDETVLITGESGTGKELVARHILRKSSRHGKPFVAFNAAAIQDTLIESEMFGHIKGAFTGAQSDSPGYVGAAEGGTLFIDEIGEMPLPLQSKILRFLQEKEYMPVGSSTVRHADVRVITATNKDLYTLVKAGTFREDLYYRLKRFTLFIEPLRERKEDIAPLAEFFMEKYCRQYKKQFMKLSEQFIARLQAQPWRGNVRDLENYMASWVLSGGNQELSHNERKTEPEKSDNLLTFRIGEMTLEAFEKEVIIAALRHTDGNKSKAAALLGISQRTIYRKITEDEI